MEVALTNCEALNWNFRTLRLPLAEVSWLQICLRPVAIGVGYDEAGVHTSPAWKQDLTVECCTDARSRGHFSPSSSQVSRDLPVGW